MPIFAEHREVRVTARESCKTPFIAPDMAPVSLLNRELEKGTKGWTDFDYKIELEGDARPVGLADRQLEEITVGTALPKVRVRREVARKRPTTRRWA